MEEKLNQTLDEMNKLIGTMRTLCTQLNTYEERVKTHARVIQDLQAREIIDREAIKELITKIEKLEKKLSGDVMYV